MQNCINKEIHIRKLIPEDIPRAMELVLAEGWNQTERDWKIFIENPRNSCKCAVVGDIIVGTITSIVYANKTAWISMVLVDKLFRGRGISKVLLRSVLDELNSFQSIKLDATELGQPVYERFGFKKEYTLTRMVCNSFEKIESEVIDDKTVQIEEGDTDGIVEFDKKIFGSERKDLIQYLLRFQEKCFVLKRDGSINGIILGRVGNRFHQIGPVHAGSLFDSKQLISRVLNSLRGKSIVVDILDDKPELTRWLETLGFEKKRSFTRMYLKANPFPGETGKQYLICGPEFG